MHLRFDKSTTPEFAAWTGLPELDEQQQKHVASELKKNVTGILDANFEGDILLLKPDVHVLFEETVAQAIGRLEVLFPEDSLTYVARDAVKAFNSCWPARIGN